MLVVALLEQRPEPCRRTYRRSARGAVFRSGSDARATGTSVCLHWRDEDKNATFTLARLDPETVYF